MKIRNFLIILIGLSVGTAIGIGSYTFLYAKGSSYLTNDPQSCANCHVMKEQFDGWIKSSHRNVATCNDCHTPQGIIPKYATKLSNGFWHSYAFTTGDFKDPIQIKLRNKEVLKSACRKCHAEIIQAIDTHSNESNMSDCISCHNTVGHL
ncbi:MAG: cytochrome c nitrite reductase small subunit [Bacteroidota bacterium]